uniref:RNA-directed RNA polymerase n=1 Tax=Hymenopteran chu-related virus OKIAV147 TaxID=2789449 RepID=A0A7U3S1P9_9VIRU|nr:RdRp [Hymenopteran chu-related virus OKIAV147]
MFSSQKKQLFETPHSLVYPRKLDVALRKSTIDCFKERLRSGCTTLDDRMITFHHSKDHLLDMEPDPSAYAQILGTIISVTDQGLTLGEYKELKKFDDISDCVNKLMLIQMRSLLRNYHLPNKDEVIGKFILQERKLDMPRIVKNLLIVLESLTKVIEKSNVMYESLSKESTDEEKVAAACRTNRYSDPHDIYKMTWSSKMLVLNVQGTNYLLPRQYMLLIHNKIADIVSILLLHQTLSGNVFPANALERAYKFVKCLQKLCVKWKNEYFKIAKCLESLVIAETIAEIEDWDNTEFVDNISKELRQDPGFSYAGSELRRLLKSSSIAYRNELGCFSKIMGHPLVDMPGGAKKLHEKTNKVYDIDPKAIVDSTNLWKKSYIKNYILKNKKWPPTTLDGVGCPRPLLMAYLYQRDPDSAYVRSKWGAVNDDDYIWITIQKNMQYDKLENAIPYLKDKTITLLKSDVFMQYLIQASKNSKTRWTDTRLLLYYMVRSSCDVTHQEFLRQYEKSHTLEDLVEYLVIRIVPKEKELKDIFRGFGCQTYFNRMRCLVQEKACMKYLELFSDEQAMTIGELDLSKKLHAWRKLSLLFKGHTVLYLNLDASSWNNAFRNEVISPFMIETMDRLFGSSIFSKTHKAYQKTLFYVPDEDTTYFWEGQAGGIEGLNQDTWVIAYISQIKVAMKGRGLKYMVLCKGDDFRLGLLIPRTLLTQLTIKEIKDQITQSISEVADKFGHTIKIIDSYASEHYFNFGKYPSIGVIELSQASRKIQKTYGANNAFLPTLDDYIGAAYSNAHSTARVLPHGVLTYRVASSWACWYLKIHPTYRRCTPTQLTALLLVPSMIGGFPIIYLSNFLVRAESDLLAPFLSLLRYCREHDNPLYSLMTRFCVYPVSKRKRNIRMLCKDPYSIPNDRPVLPDSYLRQMLVLALRGIVRNEELVQLFKALDSRNTDKILAALESANVYNAKIFSAVYSCTPEGLVQELVKKFESARSVMEVIVLRRGGAFARKALMTTIDKESKLQDWRLDRLKGKKTVGTVSFLPILTECPAESAYNVRKHTWGKPIEGITNPPIEHQMKIIPAHSSLNRAWDLDNHFVLNHFPPTEFIPGENQNPAWGAGTRDPFLGKTTSRGVDPPAVRFLEKDPLLNKLTNLLEIDSWTYLVDVDERGLPIYSNFREVIAAVLRLYTPKQLTELNIFAAVRQRGTSAHHLATRGYNQSIVPNCLANLSQFFDGNAATHGRIKRIRGHYFMNYLYVYTFCYMICCIELSVSPRLDIPSNMWLVTVECPFCTTVIKETPIIVNTNLLPSSQEMRLIKSKLAERAFRQLEESLMEYAGKDYVPVNPDMLVTVELAELAIIQEYLQVSLDARGRYMDMYTQHNIDTRATHIARALAPNYHGSQIDESDFSVINLDRLFLVLCSYIYMHLSAKYSNLAEDEVILSVDHNNVQEFPWFHLMTQLSDQGRMAKFLKILHRYTEMRCSIASINISVMTVFLTKVAYKYYTEHHLHFPFVFLSYYNIANSVPRLRHHYAVALRHHIIEAAQSDLRDAVSLLLTSRSEQTIESVKLHTSAIAMACSVSVADDGVFTAYLTAQEQIIDMVIPFLHMDQLTYFEIEEHEVERRTLGYDFLRAMYPTLPWPTKDHISEFEYNEERDRIARSLLEGFTFEVVCATLTDCLTVVRNNPTIDEAEDDIFNPQEFDAEDDNALFRMDVRWNDRNDLSLMINRIDVPTEIIYPTSYPEFWFDDEYDLLNYSEAYKIYGDATSAMSRYADAFTHMGIIGQQRRSVQAFIVGDGLGGTSSFVCATFPNSQLTICTLREEPGQAAIPPLTEEYALQTGCQVDASAYHYDRADVSDPNNLRAIELSRTLYNLVISDIEPRGASDRVDPIYWIYIAQFFLRNRSHSSLLIIQLRLHHVRYLIKLVSLLYPYVTNIILYKSLTMTRHGGAFLIAYGFRRSYCDSYSLTDYPCSVALQGLVINFIGKMHRRFLSLGRIDGISINLDGIQFEVMSPWIMLLRKLCDADLDRKLHLSLDWRSILDQIRRGDALNEILKDHYPHEGEIAYSRYMEVVRTGEDALAAGAHVHAGSRAHATLMYSRAIRLQGFLYTYRFLMKTQRRVISDQIVRGWYIQIVEQAPRRLQIPVISNDHFKFALLSTDGYELRLYAHFISGVKRAIMVVSTVMHLQYYTRNAPPPVQEAAAPHDLLEL